MSRPYISRTIRNKIAKAAHYRCGYCQSQTLLTGLAMQIEHIIPVAAGGSSDESNLWLACSTCNQHKWTKVTGLDPESKQQVPLFNPRQQRWVDHFAWSKDKLYIIGLTPIGRVTIKTLNMNNLLIVQARHIWAGSGLHPPTD